MSEPPVDIEDVMRAYENLAKKMGTPVTEVIANDIDRIRDDLFQLDWSKTNLYEYSGRLTAQMRAASFLKLPASESLEKARDIVLTLGYVREKFPLMYSTWFSSFDPTLREQREKVFYESFKPYVNSSLIKAVRDIKRGQASDRSI